MKTRMIYSKREIYNLNYNKINQLLIFGSKLYHLGKSQCLSIKNCLKFCIALLLNAVHGTFTGPFFALPFIWRGRLVTNEC